MVRINLLRPLSAWINDVSIVPNAARPCQVLALLALNADHLVSKSALLEELWGEYPPASATTLHTYIHQLRRHIDKALTAGPGADSRRILVTERNGYSLRLHGAETDVHEFHRLARNGTAAFERGEFRTASDLFSTALSLWQTTLLPDIPTGPLLTLEALSLNDLRVAVLNRRIEADLRLGRHQELMGELRTLTRQHPIDENYAGHYLVALYHAGRVADSLKEYQRIRSTLLDELGVEPAWRLQRLQRAVLAGEPALEDPRLTPVP